ncbi:MAG: CARDB domain-containing protein, partial [Natronomonas sp.]|nr:CARDB domain-containing protein [Natronomonas sp.]
MKRLHILVVSLLVGIALAAAVPAAADVPDARLVVSDVTVTPAAPDPGNTTTVEFTVANSGGSTTGVAVDRVALRNRTDDTVHAEASGLGSLSVGDDVTLELSTAFDDAGVKDLELVVETEDEDGETVTVTRPVTIVVGGVDAAGITDDVQVDARTVLPSEIDEDEQLNVDLGADASGLLGGDSEEDDEELRTPL